MSKPRFRRTPATAVAFRPADQADHDEAGIPVDHLVMHLTEPGLEFGDAWADYTLEIIGEMVGHAERDPTARRLPRWPSLVMPPPTSITPFGGEPVEIDPTKVDPYLIKVWVSRVRCRDVPGYVEARWHPETETVTFQLKGLDGPDFDRARRALEGIKLLTLRIPTPGRPIGRRYATRRAFLEAARETAEALNNEARAVTQKNVAARLGVGERTLREYLEAFGVDWQADVKRIATEW